MIGFKCTDFLDLIGRGGGGSSNRFSAITGAGPILASGVATEIVVEDPLVEVCNLAGNGRPGARFFDNCGLTIFGDRPLTFWEVFVEVLVEVLLEVLPTTLVLLTEVLKPDLVADLVADLLFACALLFFADLATDTP